MTVLCCAYSVGAKWGAPELLKQMQQHAQDQESESDQDDTVLLLEV